MELPHFTEAVLLTSRYKFKDRDETIKGELTATVSFCLKLIVCEHLQLANKIITLGNSG